MKNDLWDKSEKMLLYSAKAQSLTSDFKSGKITQIARSKNEEADALAKLSTQGSALRVVQVSNKKAYPVKEFGEKGNENK